MSPEKWIYWNTTDRVFYGVACSALALWAIAMFIEACRSRPKVQVYAFGIKKPKGGNNGEKAKAESSSAAE